MLTIEWQLKAHLEAPNTYELQLEAWARDNVTGARDDDPVWGEYLENWAIIETMRIQFASTNMHIPEMHQCSEMDDNPSFDYGDIQEVMWNSTLSNILTFDDNDNLQG